MNLLHRLFPCRESSPMIPITPLLFPSCPDLLLEEVTSESQTIFLTVSSSKQAVACPNCAQVSTKVHSRYTRTLADVSLMDYAVRLHVHVRRFFCSNPFWGCKSLADWFPTLLCSRPRSPVGSLP